MRPDPKPAARLEDHALLHEAHGNVDPDAGPPDTWESRHEAGCVYGGFSCGYWLRVDGCPEQHWEEHHVVDGDECPCGTHFIGCKPGTMVVFDSSEPDDE